MEAQIAYSQPLFERVFGAAKTATEELEKLCEAYGVDYCRYSQVYDAIMGICEEVS